MCILEIIFITFYMNWKLLMSYLIIIMNKIKFNEIILYLIMNWNMEMNWNLEIIFFLYLCNAGLLIDLDENHVKLDQRESIGELLLSLLIENVSKIIHNFKATAKIDKYTISKNSQYILIRKMVLLMLNLFLFYQIRKYIMLFFENLPI